MTGQSPGHHDTGNGSASSSRQYDHQLHPELQEDLPDSDELTDHTIFNDDPLAGDLNTE